MILASLGKLSIAQDITGSDEDSTNVIQLATVDWGAFTDLWWVVMTTTVAATAGTLKFELVLATAANLTTAVQVCCVDIAAITDKRTATIGRFIAAMNIGKQLKQMLEDDLSIVGDTERFDDPGPRAVVCDDCYKATPPKGAATGMDRATADYIEQVIRSRIWPSFRW